MSFSYRREVDGLRALAVLPVILFHAGFAHFRGGYVGVDVFFVISGYLITSILIEELARGEFSIVRFYERRARRILPALFLVMLVCLPIAAFLLLPQFELEFSKSVASVSVFASNILFWRESGYFATATELKPLIHTWSLAVEEQFYIFFPVFLFLIWKLGRSKALGFIALTLVASLAAAQWATSAAPLAAFYLLPSRAWELLIGACAAFYLSKRDPAAATWPRAVLEAGSWMGIAMLTYAVAFFDDTTPFPGIPALVPTLGTALIILCATSTTAAGRLLACRPLVAIGLVSYSAYLWHQPLFSFARHWSVEEPAPWIFGILGLAALGFAYLSWRFVETPARARGRFTRRQVFGFAAAGSVFFAATGVAGIGLKEPYERWWLSRQDDSVKVMYGLIKKSREESDVARHADGSHGDGECRFDVEHLDENVRRQINECRVRYGSGVLVVGDSHAVDVFGIALAGSKEPFIVGVTHPGCRPGSTDPGCPYDSVLEFTRQNPSDFGHAIYVQSGFYLLRSRFRQTGRKLFEELRVDQPVSDVIVDKEHIAAVHDFVLRLSGSVKVLWLGSRVEPYIPDAFMLKAGCKYPYSLRPNEANVFEELDRHIAKLVENDANIEFVSQNSLLDLQFPRDLMSCERKLWMDGDHFSAAGEIEFGSRINLVALARAGAK